MTVKRKRVVLGLGQKLEIIVRSKVNPFLVLFRFTVRKTTVNYINRDFC